MTIFPEFERQLIELATRTAPSSAGQISRRWVRVLPQAVPAALALVVAGGAFLFLDHPSRLANHQPGSAVPAALRPIAAEIGLLRHPQDPAELQAIEQHVTSWNRRYYGMVQARPVPAWVRLAAVTPWGQKIYLVPMIASTSRDAVLGVGVGDRGAGSCCNNAAGLKARGIELPGFAGTTPGRVSGILIVPDGVATVSIVIPRQRPPHAPSGGTITITTPVHNNVAIFETTAGTAIG